MRIRYFTDTDTLYIEFRDRPVAETRAGIPEFSYEEVTAYLNQDRERRPGAAGGDTRAGRLPWHQRSSVSTD